MGKILSASKDGVEVLKLVGEVRASLAPTISHFLNRIGHDADIHSVVIDLNETDVIDSTALGLLAKISLRCQEALDHVPTIISTNDDITRILLSMGFEQVFVISTVFDSPLEGLGELPTQLVSEDVMRDQVLEAHRVLMSLNKQNEDVFRNLVEALEHEKKSSRSSHLKSVSPLKAVR